MNQWSVFSLVLFAVAMDGSRKDCTIISHM